MNIITKLFNICKDRFHWHLYPSEKELSLKSFFEVFFYIVVTASLIMLFYIWNKVPEKNISLYTETLTPDSILNDSTISVASTITLNIPATNRELPENMMSTIILDYKENKIPKSRQDSITRCKEIDNLNTISRKFYNNIWEKSPYQLLSDFYKKHPYYKGKKVAFFSIQFNNNLNSLPSDHREIYTPVTDEASPDTLHLFDIQEEESDYYYLKEYIVNKDYNFNFQTNIKSHVIGRPKWYRFEDISQSYFNIRLFTNHIDTLRLKINLCTAVDFTEMEPKPDVIGMGNIEFYNHEKLLKIQRDGLQFHARFKELENMQTIRMLGVTSVLGGIIIIFVAILFVAIYNFARWSKSHIRWGLTISLLLILLIIYLTGLYKVIM